MIIKDIFLSFLKIGAFSFGGGYAMLPLIEEEIIHNHHWIDPREFVDIIAISQMTPGPIAINSATFVGYKVYRVLGSAAGTIGVVLVSFILILLVARFILKFKESSPIIEGIFSGIRPAVIGLIASAAISIGRTSIVDLKSIFIALGVLLLLAKTKLHPIMAIVIAGIAGVVLYY